MVVTLDQGAPSVNFVTRATDRMGPAIGTGRSAT